MHPRSTLRVKVFEHAFLTKINNEHIVCGRMRAYIVVEGLIEGKAHLYHKQKPNLEIPSLSQMFGKPISITI